MDLRLALQRVEEQRFDTVKDLEKFIARHQTGTHRDDPVAELACPTCAALELRLAEMQWLEALPAAVHA